MTRRVDDHARFLYDVTRYRIRRAVPCLEASMWVGIKEDLQWKRDAAVAFRRLLTPHIVTVDGKRIYR